jgi:hypothetical protein
MDWTLDTRHSSVLLRSLLAVALAAAVAGCRDSETCEDTSEGCTPPPEEPGRYLVVTQSDAWYSSKGVERRPRDFTAKPVELIADGAGAPVSYPATVVEPGKVRFEAPPGTYLLKDSSTQFILTSSRTVDLSQRRIGRADRGGTLVESPNGNPADLVVSGMEPAPAFPFTTSLSFASLELEESGSFSSFFLAPGETFVLDSDAEYFSDWGSIPRFDPAQDVTAWVLQRMTHDAGTPSGATRTWTYRNIVRAAALRPFSFEGGTLRISASLQPLPQQQVRFDLRRDEFNALRVASTTSSTGATTSFTLYPLLKDPQDGVVDTSISPLLSFSPPSNEPQTPLAREFSYGNPYPSPWEPLALFSLTYSFTSTNHDGSRSVRGMEFFLQYESPGTLASAPIRPRISLPRDIKVDGTLAQTARILGTATPVVTWEPPALGTVTGYVVRIERLPKGASSLEIAARIYTGPDDRSVRLPPGVLTSGHEYLVRISAIHAPGVRPELAGRALAIPHSSATSSSSLLTLP